jgi:hypothetical protein
VIHATKKLRSRSNRGLQQLEKLPWGRPRPDSNVASREFFLNNVYNRISPRFVRTLALVRRLVYHRDADVSTGRYVSSYAQFQSGHTPACL